MAATNVQAFSGDVEVASNLAVDTNTLFVDSVNNKVGIGTTNPNVLLEISSDTGSATIVPTELRLSSSTNASDWDTTNPYARLAFYTGDVTLDAPGVMASIGAVKSSLAGGENTRLAFFTAEPHVERMCIVRDGNVGIGLNSPGEKLEIVGDSVSVTSDPTTDSYGQLSLGSSSNYTSGSKPSRLKIGIDHAAGGFGKGFIQGIVDGINAGVDLLLCPKGGNVGIGTTDPGGYPLRVNGSIRSTGLVIGDGQMWSINLNMYSATSGLRTVATIPGGAYTIWIRALRVGDNTYSGKIMDVILNKGQFGVSDISSYNVNSYARNDSTFGPWPEIQHSFEANGFSTNGFLKLLLYNANNGAAGVGFHVTVTLVGSTQAALVKNFSDDF